MRETESKENTSDRAYQHGHDEIKMTAYIYTTYSNIV